MLCPCGNVIVHDHLIGYNCQKCKKKFTYQELKDQIEAPKGNEYRTEYDPKKGFVIKKVNKKPKK